MSSNSSSMIQGIERGSDGQLLSDYMQDLTKDDDEYARKLHEAESGLPYMGAGIGSVSGGQNPFLSTNEGIGSGFGIPNFPLTSEFMEETIGRSAAHESRTRDVQDTESTDDVMIAEAIRYF